MRFVSAKFCKKLGTIGKNSMIDTSEILEMAVYISDIFSIADVTTLFLGLITAFIILGLFLQSVGWKK